MIKIIGIVLCVIAIMMIAIGKVKKKRKVEK